MTDEMRERVISALKSQRDNGLLGVVAARARISEKALFDCANGDGPMLLSGELSDLAEAMGVE